MYLTVKVKEKTLNKTSGLSDTRRTCHCFYCMCIFRNLMKCGLGAFRGWTTLAATTEPKKSHQIHSSVYGYNKWKLAGLFQSSLDWQAVNPGEVPQIKYTSWVCSLLLWQQKLTGLWDVCVAMICDRSAEIKLNWHHTDLFSAERCLHFWFCTAYF